MGNLKEFAFSKKGVDFKHHVKFLVKTHLISVSANPASTAVTTSVAVQCEDCTYEIEQANSPEASTLSPASSSASSCSTCSSATAEQRKSLNFLKRTTIMKRETVIEVDE